MSDPEAEAARRASGVVFAVGAYGAWGVVALYWKQLASVDPFEVLAHRVAWSLLFVGALAVALGGWPELRKTLTTPSRMPLLIATATLISFNWGLFIWAVHEGHLADVSLGYFVNPLVSVGLGTMVLKETLRRAQKGAVALASAGVVLLVVSGAGFPWIGLSLAASFGAYGLLRKIAPVEATVGLFVETLLVSPIAVFHLARRTLAGEGVLAHGEPRLVLLAIGSGVITALPLVWFAAAARRLPLSSLGLLQYIAPSLQLALAVHVFGEHVERPKWAAFGMIWAGLAVFTIDLVRGSRGAGPVTS